MSVRSAASELLQMLFPNYKPVITSDLQERINPVTGRDELHPGMDIAGLKEGTPIQQLLPA